MTTIVLNGERAEVSRDETLAHVLERMGVPCERRGVAVAVDGEVVPRARWPELTLREHARVEVLSAMQGG
jgi:sulfur carrier protein